MLVLSMAIQCWADLVKYGAREHLANTYGEFLLDDAQTEPEYNVSLSIDLEKIPQSPGTFPSPLPMRTTYRGPVATWRSSRCYTPPRRPHKG